MVMSMQVVRMMTIAEAIDETKSDKHLNQVETA